MDKHIYTVHATSNSICPTCGESFDSIIELSAHSLVHQQTANQGVYICPICRECFPFITELTAHSLVHQDNSDLEGKVECKLCSAFFASSKSLKHHNNRFHNADSKHR